MCKSISALLFVESYQIYFLLLERNISDRFVLDCSAVFEFNLRTGKKSKVTYLIIIEHRMIVCVNLPLNLGSIVMHASISNDIVHYHLFSASIRLRIFHFTLLKFPFSFLF